MNWYKFAHFILLADKRQHLLNNGYSPEIANWAVKLNNKYANWLARLAKEKQVIPGEDDEKIKSLIKRFLRIKNKLDERDINKYEKYSDLVKAVNAVPAPVSVSKKDLKNARAEDLATFLMEKDGYRVYNLDSYEAASKLKSPVTEWCIAYPDAYEQYTTKKDEYEEEEDSYYTPEGTNPLYMVMKGNEYYALMHFESGQFMDRNDDPLPLKEKLRLVDLASPATGMNIKDSPHLSYEYASNIIEGRYPEGEKAIASDANTAFQYAQFIEGRFPEGEKAIASQANMAQLYAKFIIKQTGERLPEIEKGIAKDPFNASEYAKFIIEQTGERLPEMEKVIVTIGQVLINYIGSLIEITNKRFPDLEKELINDNIWEYRHDQREKIHYYALRVLDKFNQRIPVLENKLTEYSTSAFDYATAFFKKTGKRIPEMEKAITYTEDAKRYAILMFPFAGRLPEMEKVIIKDVVQSYEYAYFIFKQTGERIPEIEWAVLSPKNEDAKTNIRTVDYGRMIFEQTGQRSPEVEASIIRDNDSYAAADYAKMIYKNTNQRIPTMEAVIGKDAYKSMNYAEDVIKNRFPAGEAAIALSPNISYHYAMFILQTFGQRIPVIENAIPKEDIYQSRVFPSQYWNIVNKMENTEQVLNES